MRIIGGRFKGRRFRPPADKWPTRPTTDFAKEALFNILENSISFEDIRMLDLFGGTGNHTYEAISRGCKEVVYVDKHRPAVQYVTRLADDLGIKDNLTILRMDAARFIQSTDLVFDYIFAGPPYPLPWLSEIPARVFCQELITAGGLLVLEHNLHHHFGDDPHFEQLRKYGGTHFSFFKANGSNAK